MKEYLLSIYQPDTGAPPPDVLNRIMREVEAYIAETRSAGAWVFNGGLYPPHTATVLRLENGGIVTTDGPYAEGKEHVGGFVIVRAPDLDAALEWGRKLSRIVTLPIEVRPFAHLAS